MSNDSNDLPPLSMPKGGRPKGLPNNDHKELIAKCHKNNIDVFEEVLKDIKSGDQKARSSALKTAMDFLYAKRKAIEISGSLGIDHTEQLKHLAKLDELGMLDDINPKTEAK